MSEELPESLVPYNPDTQFSGKPLDRVTAMFALHHEHRGLQTKSIDCTFHATLENREQTYERLVILSKEPKEIDLAWLNGIAGEFAIKNVTKFDSLRKPSPEETDRVNNSIAFISFDEEAEWQIRPGRFFLAEFATIRKLKAWAAEEETQILVFAVPR